MLIATAAKDYLEACGLPEKGLSGRGRRRVRTGIFRR